MKNLKNSSFSHLFITAFVIVIGLSNVSLTKPVKEVSAFSFLVQNTEDGLKLISKSGTAWKEVTFSLEENKSQAINQFGMASIEKEYAPKDSRLANFLFTVKKTKDGLAFEGIRGTAWKNLSFSCDKKGCNQLINQYGMVEK